jgi:uncharacterized Zn-binding protein involved in type VI secretion
MPPAARSTDATSHPGILLAAGAVTSVLIGKQPAAVDGTGHTCAMPPTAGPHPPSTVVGGSTKVLIGGRSAARIGDKVGCGAMITTGFPSVLIG